MIAVWSIAKVCQYFLIILKHVFWSTVTEGYIEFNWIKWQRLETEMNHSHDNTFTFGIFQLVSLQTKWGILSKFEFYRLLAKGTSWNQLEALHF